MWVRVVSPLINQHILNFKIHRTIIGQTHTHTHIAFNTKTDTYKAVVEAAERLWLSAKTGALDTAALRHHKHQYTERERERAEEGWGESEMKEEGEKNFNTPVKDNKILR